MKDLIAVSKIMKKRVWSIARFGAFMTKRGLLKHRRLVGELQVMMKRRKKSLIIHYHPKSCNESRLCAKEYEFSCNSSPMNNIPAFQFKKRNLLDSFITSLASTIPCIYIDEKEMNLSQEYVTSDNVEASDFHYYVDEDWRTACSSSPSTSSRWSVEENEGEFDYAHEVDKQADAFIAKFYNEMELQRQSSLCQYKEMLGRGAS